MRKWPLSLILCGLALAYSGSAQPDPIASPVPDPAPTNAVQSLAGRIQVEGYGNVPFADTEASRLEAYQAAVLDAYQQLFWQGGEHMGLFAQGQSPEFRSFRIDAQHPNPTLLAWLLRSEVLSQQLQGRRLRVVVQSPPLSELTLEEPSLARSQSLDVDGDGQAETLALTHDGRVMLFKNGRDGARLLASSPSLNVFACDVLQTNRDKENWEQVQLSRAVAFSGVEKLAGGKLRLLVDLTLGETVDECWIGKASEQREVLLRWDDSRPEPQIEVTEPRDFFHTQKAQVGWKGLLRTAAGLESARLRVNGRPFWQTPDVLASRERLRMDILLPLLPGVNRAQVTVTDQSRRSASRELLLYREAPCPGLQARKRRALLVGVPEYAADQFPRLPRVGADLERLRSMLLKTPGGGFDPANVTTLSGSQATRSAILEALKKSARAEGEERVYLFVYFAGLSSAGSGSGRGLLPYDARGFDQGAVTPGDLKSALGDLRQQDVLLLVDTSQSSLEPAPPDRTWLDTQDFCESLAREGWAVVSSVDAPAARRDGDSGSRLLTAFLEGCSVAADGNRDGFVEWDEAYKHLFQTLQISSPGSPLPVRRGQLLGRVPLSVCK